MVHLKSPDRPGTKQFNTNNTNNSELPTSSKQLWGIYSIQIEAKQLHETLQIFKKENE